MGGAKAAAPAVQTKSHRVSDTRRTGEQKGADDRVSAHASSAPPQLPKKVPQDKSAILQKIKNGEKVDADAIFDESQFEDIDDEEANAEVEAFKSSLFGGGGLFGSSSLSCACFSFNSKS